MRSDLPPKKRLVAKGMDNMTSISFSQSLATSVAKVLLEFFFLFPGPEPASCA